MVLFLYDSDALESIGNFGDILAGYFAKRMGLPIAKLVIATNENDILYRFWQSGAYEKHPVHGSKIEGGVEGDRAKSARPEGVKATLSPAMVSMYEISSSSSRCLCTIFLGRTNSLISSSILRIFL